MSRDRRLRSNIGMDEMLANPFWHALRTEHASFAVGRGPACRYPAEVLPFGGLADTGMNSLKALWELLAPGEAIYVTGDQLATVPGLVKLGDLPGWQMNSNGQSAYPPNGSVAVQQLGKANVREMVALTDVAFPGYFRSETYRLGSYFGIRVDGELLAMAGERVALPGLREISAVCTHPKATGQGYAATLIRHIQHAHARAGVRSFLHVAAANERALDLYERLGFLKTRPMLFHHVRRE